jgi:hypothetical protein
MRRLLGFLLTAHNELWRFTLRGRSEQKGSKYFTAQATALLVGVEMSYLIAVQMIFFLYGGSDWGVFHNRIRTFALLMALLLAHRIFLPQIFVPRLAEKDFDSAPLTKEIVFARIFLSVGPLTCGVLALYGYAIHYKPYPP